jgi:multidrug transporter EmrE-like cation transporter
MKIITFYWTLVAISSTVASVMLMKQYAETKQLFWSALSVVSYIFLILSCSSLFAIKDVAIVYPLVKASSIAIIVMLGVFFYKEKLDTQSMIAILMIIIATLMLSKKL